MAPDTYAIGVDLGTANTCVGVYRHGHVEIIPVDGHHSMPSYVAFTDTHRLIGAAAKNQARINPENTIFDVMRFVGRRFADVELQADMRHYPFKIVDKQGKPHIRVEYKGCTKFLTPEEVISMILGRAKESAEAYLGAIVSGAVITVPACFNTSQRHSIRDAALIAGLPLLLQVSGPTAAATDYTISRWQDEMKNVLVFDLGAGTCDVVLATIGGGILEVNSVASDLHLGGEDFDNRIVDHFVYAFKHRQKKDLTSSSRSLRRLRTACEGAKHELSSRKETQIEVDSIFDGTDLKSVLTRTTFEVLCADLFSSVIELVERVLKDGKMDKSDVHEVVVAGGSCRIPQIQNLLFAFFNGKDISRSLNPDEAAARGAAMHAAIHSSYDNLPSKLRQFLLLDVLPISLGIEAAGGMMKPLIKRNGIIPTQKTEVFSTLKENQSHFQVSIFEGERARTKDCTFLGKFSIPLTLAPLGVPQIQVTFDCDKHCNTTVTAAEIGTQRDGQLHLSTCERLSKKDIKYMLAEAEKYKADDEVEAERISARNALELYAYSLKSKMRDSKFATEARMVEMIIIWLEENQSATTWEYRLRHATLEALLAGVSRRPSSPGETDSVERESPKAVTIKVDSPGNLRSPGQPSQMPDPPPQMPDPSPQIPDPSPQIPDSPPQMPDSPPQIPDPPPQIPDPPPQIPDPPPQIPDPPPQIPDPPPQPSQSFSTEAPRDSEARTNISNAPSPDGLPSNDRGLGDLFSAPTSSGELQHTYTDAELTLISTHLRNSGRVSWSNVPRLYTVLRLIGQLPMLDSFVDEGITDIWFPFTSASLPGTLAPSARANFLRSQSVVLSKSLRFETSSERTHAHFTDGEPLPYEVVGRLGSGAHGYVEKVMSLISHREYARKSFRRVKRIGKENIKSFLIELQVLKRISHIHCVELVQSYTDPKYFAIVMSPVADCNLFEYYGFACNSADKLSLLRSFFGCLANALQYLHEVKIRHRDIKPENILVKADRVFLSDFGIAFDWAHLSRSTTTADSGKTRPYAAPEVARYEKRNTSSDIWSLGCVFLEMVTILKGETVVSMRDFFKKSNGNYWVYTNIDIVPEWIDKIRALGTAKDDPPMNWVTQMLQETPELRPTAAKLFNDIGTECDSQHVQYCGPCCREAIESSEADDGDDDHLWGLAGELTIDSAEE